MGESSMNLVLPIDANENYVPLDPIVVMEMVSMTEPDIQNLKRVLADNKSESDQMGVFCICSLKNAIAVEQIKSEILELSIEGHIYEKAPNQGENEAIKELDAGGVSGRFNPNSEILNTGSIQGEEIPYLIIAD